jgi:pimeloyl-ACP methyl ester carboxylesterase
MACVTTMIPVGRHRLAATVFGEGAPAVVIEPAFGGNAAAWRSIAERIAGETTVVTYDRAPYGPSSPARDSRSPARIVADLEEVLGHLEITGPLVLVGHSIGGVYARAFAARHMSRVAGMVLVDSSHEGQWAVLPALYTPKRKLACALFVPRVIVSGRRQRGGADRRSMLREYRAFRGLTAADLPFGPGGLGRRPLAVLTRGPEGPGDADRLWRAWHALQQELAGLSENSRHVISGSPRHFLNEADPDLIIAAVTDVIRCVRTGVRLGEPVAAAEPPGGGGLPRVVRPGWVRPGRRERAVALEPRDRSE